MPDGDLVVADTSPLCNLALIGRIGLHRAPFDEITVPEQVWQELTAGDAGLEDLRVLRDDGFLELVTVEESALFVQLRRQLDFGEAATVVYAIEADAHLVLLDERDARQVARRHALSITGVIGLLLRVARQDRVDLRTELDRLRAEGFYLDDALYQDVLEAVDDE